MRHAWTLLLLLGCSEPTPPPKPEPAVEAKAEVSLPADMVEAILNPQVDVPVPPVDDAQGVLNTLGAAFDQHLEAAANAPAKPHVKLLSTSWCTWCGPAKAKVKPYLESKGCTVEVVDCTDEKVAEKHNAASFPQYIFEVGGKEVARVKGTGLDTKGNVYPSHFKDALEKCKPAPAVGSFGMPTIELSEFSHLVTGKTFEFGAGAKLIVPANVTWKATAKPSSVLLTFPEGRRPELYIRKFIVIRMNPQVLSVEIGPNFVEIKTDSSASFLATARLDFDWSPPAPAKKTAGRPRFYYSPPQQQRVPQRAPAAKAEDKEPEPTLAPLSINPEQPVIPAMRKAWLASVSITTLKPTVSSYFSIPAPSLTESGGSGFVFRPDGYILTNHHVVEGCVNFKVTFCNGQQRQAKVVGADDKADIAVLKVDETNLTTMPICQKPALVAGSEVYVLGSPFGFHSSLCRGIISNVNREIEYADGAKASGLLQTDAGVNYGNSGGAMLNPKGEAVGVAVAKREGIKIGFAIPIAKAMEAADRLAKP